MAITRDDGTKMVAHDGAAAAAASGPNAEPNMRLRFTTEMNDTIIDILLQDLQRKAQQQNLRSIEVSFQGSYDNFLKVCTVLQKIKEFTYKFITITFWP